MLLELRPAVSVLEGDRRRGSEKLHLRPRTLAKRVDRLVSVNRL